jgi:putative tryptophan/tyrosine transport system substrate-binding protein
MMLRLALIAWAAVLAPALLVGAAAAQEPEIAGTISLDPSVQKQLPARPLLIINASHHPDLTKAPIIVKRIPGATFPHRYTLTADDITLVGSSFEGHLYVTARIDAGGSDAAVILEGASPKNPAPIGAKNVDVTLRAPARAVSAGKTAVPPPSRKMLRIGLLWSGPTAFGGWAVSETLHRAFRELGYVEGQNIHFEPRYAEGRYDRLPELAAGLVSLKVDVILAAGDSAAIQAAKNATSSIPIVMMALADPVQLQLVKSLARPGANVTGLSFPLGAIAAKQLELIKTAAPRIERVAVLWNPDNPGHLPVFRALNPAAKSLGLRLQRMEVRSANDFPDAFELMKAAKTDAAVVLWDPMLNAHGGRLTVLALKHRMPMISTYRDFAEATGLMAYGPPMPSIFRGAAAYVDKIVNGSSPADLPVERPARFELVVNLTTAKVLGLELPPAILTRADRVIR